MVHGIVEAGLETKAYVIEARTEDYSNKTTVIGVRF
jgi:hypothetical protein